MHTLIGRTAAVTMLAGVALCGSACSGSGDARPSTAQLETALSSGPGTVLGQSISSVSADAPGCVAKVLHDSSLSDAVLRAIVDGHPDPTLGSADRADFKAVRPRIIDCIPELRY